MHVCVRARVRARVCACTCARACVRAVWPLLHNRNVVQSIAQRIAAEFAGWKHIHVVHASIQRVTCVSVDFHVKGLSFVEWRAINHDGTHIGGDLIIDMITVFIDSRNLDL